MHKAHTEVSTRSTLRRAPESLHEQSTQSARVGRAAELRQRRPGSTDQRWQEAQLGVNNQEADHRATRLSPRTQRLCWPTQSLPRSRTGTSELLSESCVPKISRRRIRTACTHNWSTSTLHLRQIEVPFQIHNQRSAQHVLFRPDQQEDLTESDRNTSWRWSAAENSVQH